MAKGKKTGGRTKGTPNRRPGRPSLYTNALAERLCERIAKGETLNQVCFSEDMPAARTVFTWRKEKEDFAKRFDGAMERHTHWCFDEMVRIAKDGTDDSKIVDGKVIANNAKVQRDRLQVDVLTHRCAKLNPQTYGDLTRLEHTGKDGFPLIPDEVEVARRLAFILARGAEAADLQKNRPLLEFKPDPPSETKWQPPPEPRPEADVFDSTAGKYVSAKEFRQKWGTVPAPEPQPTHTTDEIVFLYDSDGRPHRIDTVSRAEQGTVRTFPQVITRRPGG